MLELFMKNSSPWKPKLGQFGKDGIPWEGPHAEAEEENEDEVTTEKEL